MDYKRLTKKTGSGYSIDGNVDVINELGRLEDEIENKQLLRPPCKIGDTVFEINIKDYKLYPYEHIISDIQLRECIIIYWQDGQTNKDYGYLFDNTFLTKEDAENKIKEINRGKYFD